MYWKVPQSVNEQMCWITMKTSKNVIHTENKWWKNYRNYIKVFMSGKLMILEIMSLTLNSVSLEDWFINME